MKPYQTRWAVIAVFFLIFAALPSAAAVPLQISFQGMLTDADGQPVADGNYAMTFAIYDVASGGTAVWSESQTVAVSGGIYNVTLGQPGNQIDPVDLDGVRYLGVRVGTDSEMTPRQPITSSAFAIRAALADDADTLDGLDASAFGDITGVTAGTGLSGGGTTGTVTVSANTSYLQRRVSGSCPAGQSIRTVNADGTVVCEIDDDAGGDITGVTAGSGLTGGGTTGTVTIGASFAGSGTATTVARSDHSHDSRYFTESEVNTLVAGLQSQIDALQSTVNSLSTLLAGVGRAGNDITFSGVNVRVVNGTGSTEGSVNGLGNLIVGYDEARSSGSDKSGSHNIVVGRNHNYASYGGLVVGFNNTISGRYASVSGGDYNRASGNNASIGGGYGNSAGGYDASVSGGYNNHADGICSSVSGGNTNTASGTDASVSGGARNTAGGSCAAISGGRYNTASGGYSVVSGGGGTNTTDGNIAFADYSVVSGGWRNIAGDPDLTDHSIGTQSTVTAGSGNIASGARASVSGGYENSASGAGASVSGGAYNNATAIGASVSGGNSTTVSNNFDWAAGDLYEDD